MHDYGCLPVLYPRPYTSHYPVMHSGFYGQDFTYCPPLNFCDGRDTTCAGSLCFPDGINGTQYGFIELCWRLYITCSGPTKTQTATWGDIKSLYR
jgi:hypothetical protein